MLSEPRRGEFNTGTQGIPPEGRPQGSLSTVYLKTFVLLLALVTGACSSDNSGAAVSLTVSAAASLTFAFEEIAPLFERETGIKVVYNFGSSGQLARQIEQGAPVDLFASANLAYIEELEKQGLTLPQTRTLFARGHLILWCRADGPPQLHSLEDLLQPEIERFAMANPDYAPYGVAARQALRNTGLWEKLQPKLILGQHARQTLHYAESGNVDAALVARSLARQHEGRWIALDENLYTPIHQALALVASTVHPEAARRFAAFVTTPRAQTILHQYGFLPPAGAPSP